MKDTKEKIFNAFKEAQQKLKAAASNKVDIKAEVQAQAQEDMIQAAEKLSQNDIEGLISSLKKATTVTLDKLSEQISEQSKAFSTLSDAVVAKRIELEELFQIEDAAHALVALVNTKESVAAEYDANFAKRKEEAEAALAAVLLEVRDQREAFKAEIKAAKEAIDQQRQREEEEYKYDFNRRKKQAEDKLADDLTNARKMANVALREEENALAERKKQLEAQWAELEAREQHLEELQDKVDNIPNVVAAEVRSAVGRETGILRNHFESEKKIISAQNEAELKIKSNQIDNLTESLEKANAEIVSLREQLAKATDNVKDMALESIKSSSDSKLAASLSRTVSELSSQKPLK